LEIGVQHASARPWEFLPRTGTPGHGPPVTGTGRACCGAFGGNHPDVAGVKTQLAKPDLRQ